MSRRGYFLIADLTGYTVFLTKSELEHAQGVLEGIFAALVEQLKDPLVVSNFEGDAVLVYLPDEGVPRGQVVLEAIERLYCTFAATLEAMQRNTTCICNACRNIGQLDLKFIVHHGAYVLQSMGSRQELQGPDVIRTHRLLKNDVTRATGIKAYALITADAATAMGLPTFFAGLPRHVETIDDLGATSAYVHDLHPVWAQRREARRVEILPGEKLAFEVQECELPVPPALAWSYVTDVDLQRQWQQGLASIRMTGLTRDRVGLGAIQHCAHGKQEMQHKIVDWRPFDYVTYHIACPLGTLMRQMIRFTPTAAGGTRVTLSFAEPEGAGRLSTGVVRLMLGLQRRSIEGLQRASTEALVRLVAQDLTAGRIACHPARPIPDADLKAAATAAIAS